MAIDLPRPCICRYAPRGPCSDVVSRGFFPSNFAASASDKPPSFPRALFRLSDAATTEENTAFQTYRKSNGSHDEVIEKKISFVLFKIVSI